MDSDFVKRTRSAQSVGLMASFDRLRRKKFLCDFTVGVGNISFPVHRIILAASSEYFEAMFSHKTKEVRDGFVEMKNVDQDGILQCIEFMYMGKADLNIDNIQNVLHTSSLLQIVRLKNLCFHYLQQNISPTNCLSIFNLAQMYGCPVLKGKATKLVIANFDSIISSEMFPFIDKLDLMHYMNEYAKVTNVRYQTLWQAMITWAAEQNGNILNDFSDIFTSVDIRIFPFKFLLETVLNEPLVNKNEITKNAAVIALFSDINCMEWNLEVDNCFILNDLAGNLHVPQQSDVKIVIQRFLEVNFEQIVSNNGFCLVSKDVITQLIQSDNTGHFPETVKWNAALKWVKYDIPNRKKYFEELFSLLKLHNFRLQYLKDKIGFENLVEKSENCNALLMNELISRLTAKGELSSQCCSAYNGSTSSAQSHLTRRIIPHQPQRGTISIRRLVEPLPGYKQWPTRKIIFTFQEGVMMGVPYDTSEFVSYLPDSHEGWRVCNLIEKAFDKGFLFQLQEFSSGFGRVIWNPQIQLKTSNTGGVVNNGYPDLNYFRNLCETLRARGID